MQLDALIKTLILGSPFYVLTCCLMFREEVADLFQNRWYLLRITILRLKRHRLLLDLRSKRRKARQMRADGNPMAKSLIDLDTGKVSVGENGFLYVPPFKERNQRCNSSAA